MPTRRPGSPERSVQGLEHRVERVLRLEPDTRDLRHPDTTFHHGYVVGKAAEGREDFRVALIAAKPEAHGDVQRELVPAMRDAAARTPAVFDQHRERPQILHQAI